MSAQLWFREGFHSVLPVPSDTDAPGLCTAVDPSVPSMSSCCQQQNPAHNLNLVNNNVSEGNDNTGLNLSYTTTITTETITENGSDKQKQIVHIPISSFNEHTFLATYSRIGRVIKGAPLGIAASRLLYCCLRNKHYSFNTHCSYMVTVSVTANVCHIWHVMINGSYTHKCIFILHTCYKPQL